MGRELGKVSSQYLRHDLVRHFDNLHKINKLGPLKLAQLTTNRHVGNDLSRRSQLSNETANSMLPMKIYNQSNSPQPQMSPRSSPQARTQRVEHAPPPPALPQELLQRRQEAVVQSDEVTAPLQRSRELRRSVILFTPSEVILLERKTMLYVRNRD